MKHFPLIDSHRAALAGVGLTLLLLAPVLSAPARAQGPGGGGFGGGARRQPPFAVGTVTSVDTAAGTIVITPQFGGGQSQTIQTTSQTKISVQNTATVADLKVGDKVTVQGMPTAITASSLMVGDSPIPAGRGGGRGAGGPAVAPGSGGAATAEQLATATATGTVASLDPLTITLSPIVTLTLKMAANAKVTKFTPATLSSIKTGQTIIASGQTGDDGTLTASMIGANVDLASLMAGRGGFGGGGAGGYGGGFGGRGGRRRQAGGGGFGGGQGGGQADAGQADPGQAPPPPADPNGAAPVEQ